MVTNYTVLLLIRNGIISGKFSYQVGHVTDGMGHVISHDFLYGHVISHDIM